MAENSNIEWTDGTANLWEGCVKVSPACDNCYAETRANRYGHDCWGADKPRIKIKSFYQTLNKLRKQAQKEGVKKKVFVGSLMDIFEKAIPMVTHTGEELEYKTDFLRLEFFEKISNGEYDDLIFQLLTKRPSNINKMIPESWLENPPENVWFGTSVGNQDMAIINIIHLSKVNGNRFISMEPMLERVNLLFRTQFRADAPRLIEFLDWIIIGGESGPSKRPFDPDWAREAYRHAGHYNIPVFMKQWDKVQQLPEDLINIKQFPKEMV